MTDRINEQIKEPFSPPFLRILKKILLWNFIIIIFSVIGICIFNFYQLQMVSWRLHGYYGIHKVEIKMTSVMTQSNGILTFSKAFYGGNLLLTIEQDIQPFFGQLQEQIRYNLDELFTLLKQNAVDPKNDLLNLDEYKNYM